MSNQKQGVKIGREGGREMQGGFHFRREAMGWRGGGAAAGGDIGLTPKEDRGKAMCTSGRKDFPTKGTADAQTLRESNPGLGGTGKSGWWNKWGGGAGAAQQLR